jgi:FkbM family methyltransferase
MNLIFTILRKRISGLELLRRKIAHHYLQEVAERHIKEREQRLSVFANDLIGISIFLDGIYEREHIQTLLTLLVFSRHFSEVYAFEPHPQTFDLLSMNISRVGNIKAYNIGVGEKAEQMLLHENISNMGGSSVVNDSGQKSIQVNVSPLDDALDSPIPISLIKIDIEGMEYSALKGAVETIKIHHPIIAFEQHESLFAQGTTAIPYVSVRKSHHGPIQC